MKTIERVRTLAMGLLTLAAVTMIPGSVWATSYAIGPGSTVGFKAEITATSFTAESKVVTGVIDYDETEGRIRSGAISVRVDTLDTGIGMRTRHMQEKYLEADKHPDIQLSIENAPVAAVAGAKGEFLVTFTIKGVKKPTKVPVEIAGGEDGALLVTSTFPLDITDYGIPQPKFAVVKMEPVIAVTAKLVLKAR